MANNIGEKIKEVTNLAEKSVEAVVSGNNALQKNVEEIKNIKNREETIKIAQFSKAREEVSSVVANAAIKISEEYIKWIEDWINNLLRPMFGYKSALQV